MYSSSVPKVCRLCQYASLKGDKEMYAECSLKKRSVNISGSCARFKYDIFKKPVRRRRKPDMSSFSPDDFKL